MATVYKVSELAWVSLATTSRLMNDGGSCAGSEPFALQVLGDHMEPRADGSSTFWPVRTPDPLCATAYYCCSTWILASIADILGHGENAAKYAQLALEIRDAFNREFFNPETRT